MSKTKTTKPAMNFLIQDVDSGHFLTKNDTLSPDASRSDALQYVSAKIAQDTIDEISEEVRDHTDPKPHALTGYRFRVYDRENPPYDGAEPSETFEGPAEDAPTDYEIVDAEPVVQGELLPEDAGTAAPTPSAMKGVLQLSSPGVALMTAAALKAHAADLKKLAKGARDLSQPKEAATFEQNASLIEETLLSQLEPQAKLPFGYTDVKAAISARVQGKLRAQLAMKVKQSTPIVAGEQDADRQAKIAQRIDEFEAIIGSVADIVTALVEPAITAAAEHGMTAGRLARETTADTLALEAVQGVES